jgi:hypothetical protein
MWIGKLQGDQAQMDGPVESCTVPKSRGSVIGVLIKVDEDASSSG